MEDVVAVVLTNPLRRLRIDLDYGHRAVTSQGVLKRS
jgi:hypothetical protein